jgi:hypothetical protein
MMENDDAVIAIRREKDEVVRALITAKEQRDKAYSECIAKDAEIERLKSEVDAYDLSHAEIAAGIVGECPQCCEMRTEIERLKQMIAARVDEKNIRVEMGQSEKGFHLVVTAPACLKTEEELAKDIAGMVATLHDATITELAKSVAKDNERLRKALEDILDMYGWNELMSDDCKAMRDLAKQALASGKEER